MCRVSVWGDITKKSYKYLVWRVSWRVSVSKGFTYISCRRLLKKILSPAGAAIIYNGPEYRGFQVPSETDIGLYGLVICPQK